MKYVLAAIAIFICWYLLAAGFASFVTMDNWFDITKWDEFYRALWLASGLVVSGWVCEGVKWNNKSK